MRSIYFLSILSFFLFESFGSEIKKNAFEIQFTEISSKADWKAILTSAKNENKLIFADAYTDWCGWCKELDEKVYTDANLADFFNDQFINVKFDAEGDFGSQLAEKMAITAFPTLLYITPEGQTFEKIEGFVAVEALRAYADQTINDWKLWPSLLTKQKQGNLSKQEFRTMIAITEKNDPLKAGDLAAEYIANFSPDDYREIENIWLVSRYLNTLDSFPFQHIILHKNDIITWHGQSEYNDYLSAVYNDNLSLAIKYGDKELMERIVSELLPELMENDLMPRAIFTTRSIYYAQREEFDNYHMEVNSYLNNHLSEESKIPFILSTTYEVLESYPLDKNLTFLDKLLNLGLSQDETSFEVTSLLGYVKAIQENFKKANELLEKATQLANNDEELELVASLKDAVEYLRGGN